MHPGGTVPPFKMHPGGTVPPFEMHPGGTLSFYDINILSLILDYRAKINDRSLHPFCNLSHLIRSSKQPSFCMEASFLEIYPEARPYLSNAPVSRDLGLNIILMTRIKI